MKFRPLFILSPFVILVFFLLICGCISSPSLSGNPDSAGITILVDDPHALDMVQNLGREYENKTGVSVSIKQVQSTGDDVASHQKGDLLIAGISRIPVYASKGRLEPLNTFLSTNSTVNWSVIERPSLNMVGEYPEHTGTIYALPFSQDALGIVYRSDLLDDPKESAAFCITYGYPLGVPGSYSELKDIAEFFSRNSSNLAGIGFAGLGGSDPISSPWLSIVTSYGSAISGASDKAAGTWNSSRTVTAMTAMRNLSRYEPSGAEKWGDKDVAIALDSGTIAMGVTWFSQFPDIQSAAEEHNLSFGYIPLPGEITADGSFRAITVRIDGIGLLKDGSQDRAKEFLTWFYSPAVQFSLAESGHQPALLTVLDSYPYLNMNPFNRALPESMRVGVSAEKGQYADEVRNVTENAVNAIISPEGNVSQEEILKILDTSAGVIDSIRQGGVSKP
ncbi:MAG TPA: extracellular solute-binding protein [Methanospirillum sp.]|uniref:ABC transporter substrate-binding protein n=1 Tax=Methanospirillum sp. TaxID=45200 RepID=UPI002CF0D277|nr:extracellular solute-binding protein [Methanospirillum sp.]HWQ62964.1 extracellular solute-binding protein [Methanospirillum sp.]